MATIERTPAEVFPPGEFLQDELEAREWSQADLADILGKSTKAVSEIALGKRRITPEMARLLSQALETSPNVWLNLESAYQLYKAEHTSPVTDDVSRRAKIYKEFPVREMIKRGWIDRTDNVDILEAQLSAFHSSKFSYAARKRDDEAKTSLQLAWLHRTYNLAKRMHVEKYSEAKLRNALTELKPLLYVEEEIRQIPEILRRAGVRFLVVEALPSSKIDGVCFWLNAKSPVVAVSLRYDRIDHFWFTLLHELHHVKFGHGKNRAILDTNVMEDGDISAEERDADDGATNFLVTPEEIDNFVARVQPLFSAAQIKGFAKRVGVHMGIAVGQLQHRNVINYNRNRNALVKVRNIICQTSTYDGWGMVA